MCSSVISAVTPRAALIALNAVPGLSPRAMFSVSRHSLLQGGFGKYSPSEAAALLGIHEKNVINWQALCASGFERAEQARADAAGVRIITILDDDYPLRLREIYDPPVVLYARGPLPQNDDIAVGVVGARHATVYGLSVAEQLSMRLAQAGAAVISGMAAGIDAAAHRGALKAVGRTVGVLGCGIDLVYPASNRGLYAEMSARGCLLSEFALGAEPLPYHFPRRNRIVSALSQAVVVVEANARSGALITAQFALEQGREVFAVPGRIDVPQSRGTHELIRNGARLFLSVEDVFEEIPGLSVQADLFRKPRSAARQGLTADERRVLALCAGDAVPFDALAAGSGIPVPALMGICLSLQMKRLVKELPGKFYAAQ
jgi:DNA processing protein